MDMEQDKAVAFNTGKGILFAFGGMLLGIILWVAVIALLGTGTGGAVGGAAAAVIAMLVAGGYKLGKGKPGAVGIIIAALFSLIAVVVSITAGTSFMIYAEGIGASVMDSFDLLLELLPINDVLRRAFLQDLLICAGIAVVMAIVTAVGNKKKD